MYVCTYVHTYIRTRHKNNTSRSKDSSLELRKSRFVMIRSCARAYIHSTRFCSLLLRLDTPPYLRRAGGSKVGMCI